MSSSDVFAVISDATRREILSLLHQGDLAVGELVDALGVSQPTVSKHLKLLRETDLVRMRADGQRRYYSLNVEPLGEVATWLGTFGATTATSAVTGPVGAESHGVHPAENGSLSSEESGDASVQQQLQRTVERAAERAADLFAHLPKLRRRRDDP